MISENDITASVKFKVRIPIASTNSSDLINSLIISYDIHTPYINVALKEYSYLSLYNSDKYNNIYKFKNLDLYSKCEKKHTKEKVVSRCIKNSYYIKCWSSPNEKEIKINEMISSVISQASKTNPTYNWSYFHKKILNQYPNLYRKCSNKNFNYYKITDKILCEVSKEIICLLCKLDHDDEEIKGRYKARFYFIKYKQYKIEITV